MQNAPNASTHSFLPYLFSCERKDRAVGDIQQIQICDNLSVSAAPSQLPWKGSLFRCGGAKKTEIVLAFLRGMCYNNNENHY